ncbi:NAD(P)-binding protein [Lojkania enalia]|uniref:NAD(P)-binding protein n=1 Tax=Lojkania enalia TaxID=147567 RepID=A0A9P4K2W0_9PLEO|nr:NAD(P)-binding protein [Didymosphaeria enalia]
MGFFLNLIRSQFFTTIPYPSSDFSGQTVIITGSNTGLGLEAARHIVRLGAAKVILAVRCVSKGEAAAQDILQSTNAKANVIDVWKLDLSSYESVKAFGARLQTLDRLDAIIQNAGIFTTKFALAEENESQITVNVVSAAQVGLYALPKLRETSQTFNVRTRLEFVGSDLYQIAKFKEAESSGYLFDALNSKDLANMDDRYAVSKLLLLFTVREIATRSPITKDSNVVIIKSTPGACKSDLFRDDFSWLQKIMMSCMNAIFARTTEVGGRILVNCARPDIEAEAHGRFLQDCRVFTNGKNIDSTKGQQLQKRWNSELFSKLENIAPGITKVLA